MGFWESEVWQFKFTVISGKIQYLLKFTVNSGETKLWGIPELGKGIDVDGEDSPEIKGTIFAWNLILFDFGVATWFCPET